MLLHHSLNTVKVVILVLIFASFLFGKSYGQEIILPENKAVYQRSNENLGQIPVVLNNIPSLSTVKVSLVDNPNTVIHLFSISSYLDTVITCMGGWYNLEVISNDNTILSRKVGVGEVFLVTGQSNAEYEGPVADDERVIGAYYSQNPPFFSITEDAKPYAWLYPSPPGTSFVGKLGTLLVQKLGVPVLFFNAASGGTSSGDWFSSANNWSQPFDKVGLVLNNFSKKYGLRTVLWHQGEANSVAYGYAVSPEIYRDQIGFVIDKSREIIGFPNLSWMVAQVSWSKALTDLSTHTEPNSLELRNNTRNGQLLLTTTKSNVYLGPDSDTIEGYKNSENRPDGVHLSYSGQTQLANLWNEKLDDHFFGTSTPYLASHVPHIRIKTDPILSYPLSINDQCLPQELSITSNSDAEMSIILENENSTFQNNTIQINNENTLYFIINIPGTQNFNAVINKRIEIKVTPFSNNPIVNIDTIKLFKNEFKYLKGSCNFGLLQGWIPTLDSTVYFQNGVTKLIALKSDFSMELKCTYNSCTSDTKYLSVVEKNCQNNPEISIVENQSNIHFQSSNNIHLESKVINSQNLTFSAANHIVLLPGCIIENTNSFTAQIEGCQ